MLLCEWILRPDGHPFDPYAIYSRYPTVFSLEIHHGCELSKAANRLYDGGKVHWFDQIDSDGFSVVEVNHMLAGLGCVNPKMEYWYKMPDKDALLPLSNDNDVLRFIKYVDRYKLMQLYVVHPIDKPKPLGDNEDTEDTFDPLFCDLDPDSSEPNATELPSEVPNVAEPSEVPNVAKGNEVPNVAYQTKIPNDAEHSDGSDESEDSDDSDFDVELEDRIEDVEVDMGDFRKYIDENVEWVGPNEVPVEDTQPVEAEVFEDLDLEYFDSASDPDDIDSNRKKALKMLARKHKHVDGNIYSDNFYCGQVFANKELIKEMVGRLVVENRRQLFVSKCTAKLLSKTVEETIKPNPKIPIAALKYQLQNKFELGVSKAKVFRAKQMEQDNVIGDYINQYARLKDYALELQEQNPDTTIKIDVERKCDVTSDTRKVRRIYVCLGALKSGFKAGKRDLLGLDGCFMSRPYPGQNLTAVGVDPNNETYPLAYAVVEAETKDSWTWCLDFLGDDLQLARNSNFTFIIDRQKGLVPALQEMFPAAVLIKYNA
ncbi:ribonuclease H-like domain-containing protein [Tanacetum coccineum]